MHCSGCYIYIYSYSQAFCGFAHSPLTFRKVQSVQYGCSTMHLRKACFEYWVLTAFLSITFCHFIRNHLTMANYDLLPPTVSSVTGLRLPSSYSIFSQSITTSFLLQYLQLEHYDFLPPTVSSVRALRPPSSYSIFSQSITTSFLLQYLQLEHYDFLPPTVSSVRALRLSSIHSIFSQNITTSFHLHSYES